MTYNNYYKDNFRFTIGVIVDSRKVVLFEYEKPLLS